MKQNNGLVVLTPEELQDIYESLSELPERRLQPTWAHIQDHKYNGMLEEGDCFQPNLIFQYIELPLIKRLYPPSTVNKLVKRWKSELLRRAKAYSKEKQDKYMQLRRAGMSIDKAREHIAPLYPDKFVNEQIQKLSGPFTYQYNISCRDADMLYTMGLERFVEVFGDRFYYPVTVKK